MRSQRALKLMWAGVVLLVISVVVMMLMANDLRAITGEGKPWYTLQLVLPAGGPLLVASTLCFVGATLVASIERGDE
jgi:hypothetical protein